MTINISIQDVDHNLHPKITVLGVGGSGGNAVNNMINANLEGVDFLIANTDIKCESNINLIEDFPIFYFDCFLNSPDKKILMKKIKIDYKNKNETLILNVKGSLNIINNKVNFDKIEVNKDYRATVEDLEYFKNSFENILFDENFIKIFDLSKLRRFISEVS